MSTEITKSEGQLSAKMELPQELLTKIILGGDITQLNPAQRVQYYVAFCERIGLDPATQPFKILETRENGKVKTVLYCDRGGAAQLVNLHKVKREIISREEKDGCFIVTAKASLPCGRSDESIGVVPIEKENGEFKDETIRGGPDKGKTYKKFYGNGTYIKMRGEALANAMMKAETKAKRRATLDLLGLGMLDESEISQETFNGQAGDGEIINGERERLKLQGINPDLAEPFTGDKNEKEAKEILGKEKKLGEILETEAVVTKEGDKSATTSTETTPSATTHAAPETKPESQPAATTTAPTANQEPAKPEPTTPTGKKLGEMTVEELPGGEEWRAHKIGCIKAAVWAGKRLDVFDADELGRMKTLWIDKYQDKINSDSVRKHEATQILMAIDYRAQQAAGAMTDAEVEAKINGTEKKTRKPRGEAK